MAIGRGSISASVLQDPLTLGRGVPQTSLEADVEVVIELCLTSFLLRKAWEGLGWPASRRQLQTVCDPGLGDGGEVCSADGCPGEQGPGPGCMSLSLSCCGIAISLGSICCPHCRGRIASPGSLACMWLGQVGLVWMTALATGWYWTQTMHWR